MRIDVGKDEFVGIRKQRFIQLSAPDHKNILVPLFIGSEKLFRILKDLYIFQRSHRFRDHDMMASRQHFRKGLKSFPSHDDRVSCRLVPEKFQIRRQMPDHLIVFAQLPVLADGRNFDQPHIRLIVSGQTKSCPYVRTLRA